MRFPEKLLKGDTIGVTAPSRGITDEVDLLRLENAIKNIQNLGYNVKVTDNCKSDFKGRSSSAKKRVEEFMSLYKDPEVKAIIFLGGGDFACEMLEELDFNELLNLPPKWIQGYSDCTNLTLTFNTLLDIASIYGPSFKSYGMQNLHDSLLSSIRLMKQEEFIQKSYEKCEKRFDFLNQEEEETKEINPYYEFELTEDVKWINLKKEDKISFKGRCIGGCIDLIREFIIGSKFDRLNDYCNKYKNDGIIWIIEEFEGNTSMAFRTLLRMKNMGLFENCNGIIFGRPLMVREDYEISYKDAINDAIGDLNIPIILDADIGHLAPQIPIVTGAILEITSENGKGTIKNIFE